MADISGEEERRSTKLYIWSDDLDPATISQLISLEPDRCHKRGQHPVTELPDGTVRQGTITYRRSLWRKAVEKQLVGQPLEVQLLHWAQLLEQRASSIEKLRALTGDIYIDCYLDEGSIAHVQIPSSVMAVFGALGVSLKISFYDWQSSDLLGSEPEGEP